MCFAYNSSAYMERDLFEIKTCSANYLASLHIGIFLIDIPRQAKV